MFKKWFGGKPKVEPAKLVAQASPPSITLAMSNASSITEKINRSGAKQAFRPNLPIDDPAFLLGRDFGTRTSSGRAFNSWPPNTDLWRSRHWQELIRNS